MTEMRPDELEEAVRQNIIARRRELGMTQTELAEKAGVKQPNISQFERGENSPSIATLARLADALQTQPAALLQTGIFSGSSA